MTNLKIAVQKSGRLSEDSLTLLKECGISLNVGKDQLIAQASNFQLEVLYLRNSDIPQYVRDGIADIAIIGDNTEKEKKTGIVPVLDLGFSRCRLSIAVPRAVEFKDLSYLQGKKIATSYPNTLKDFLTEHAIEAEIHEISGSVEIAPNIGLSDAICDVVSTGSTLVKNGLKEVYKIFESQAILAANPNLETEKKDILDQLVFRIKAVLASKNSKYILLNTPEKVLDEVCALLPGMKSPTIMPLRQKGWVSVHSVVQENEFWEVIGKLKAVGAEGILIIPIEKMIL
ncbi:ATP phosphoribosyltransferase [Culturomica massiliensis]|jgi:ATP phosphoribosyltransferase|uniref:ATP phosphoribosyltransferase n=1 Tax=Culturomica massiliensis TaxID=1841857 RepID=UPI00033B8284|nr:MULTISPECIES: ATP phosphoribosyltransferase [Odoribacteraceae]RHV97987.1 ATP phosphoribosyltransferase [Odoribacter sp. OF09-27XD]CCZ10618.1 aTP phosphoribosyltransferase [Odoribacter sp. CAG:788]